MEFADVSGLAFNAVACGTVAFFEEVAGGHRPGAGRLLRPRAPRPGRERIGIRKDHPYAPDARMTRILDEAAAVGNATARADASVSTPVTPPRSSTPTAPGRPRSSAVTAGWLIDGGVGGRDLDARTLFFYTATVDTPAMALKLIGIGSRVFEYAERDRESRYLDGSLTYRLTLPAGVPAKDSVHGRVRRADPLGAPDVAALPRAGTASATR